MRIDDNKFSPDGQTNRLRRRTIGKRANEFKLMAFDLASGAERELTGQNFFSIKSISWFPDKSGLFIAASVVPNKNYRLWQVDAAGGDEQRTKTQNPFVAFNRNSQ